ncbi:MAG: hypothetical protein K0S01_3469 [Herbinix sp.]|jgi:hypothetical protein|nr:hypothetical protein [Herbinix sp.]
MKIKNYKKIILYISTLFLITLEWYLRNFTNVINGKYSLIGKGIDVLMILFITVLLYILITLQIKDFKTKKFKVTNAILILILILLCTQFISQCFEKTPKIITDIAEGKHSSSIQLNGSTIITDSLFGHTSYRIGGRTPEGKELSLEVSVEDFYNIMKANNNKTIHINYWEHTGTLYNWEPID